MEYFPTVSAPPDENAYNPIRPRWAKGSFSARCCHRRPPSSPFFPAAAATVDIIAAAAEIAPSGNANDRKVIVVRNGSRERERGNKNSPSD